MKKTLASIIFFGMTTAAAAQGTPPPESPEWAKDLRLQVTDLWNGSKPKRMTADRRQKFPVTMKADKTKRGGIAVLKIETVPAGANY
jgi:hypothetical protein